MEASVPMPFLSISATSSLSFLKRVQVEGHLGEFGADISVVRCREGSDIENLTPNDDAFPKCNDILMEEILHQLIGSLSHYLQGLIHLRWLAGFLPSTVCANSSCIQQKTQKNKANIKQKKNLNFS